MVRTSGPIAGNMLASSMAMKSTGLDGRYLGELNNDKLIAKTSRTSRRKSRFTPRMNRMGRVKTVNHVASVMLVGYEDFPEIDGC